MMGPFTSSRLRSSIAWASSFIVSAANLLMLLDMLRLDAPEPSGSAGLKQWSISGGFRQWLRRVSSSFYRYAVSSVRTAEGCKGKGKRWQIVSIGMQLGPCTCTAALHPVHIAGVASCGWTLCTFSAAYFDHHRHHVPWHIECLTTECTVIVF
jgi:hypothetical protein